MFTSTLTSYMSLNCRDLIVFFHMWDCSREFRHSNENWPKWCAKSALRHYGREKDRTK